MLQSYARFQRLSGFKPVGPHIPAVRDLLSAVTIRCPICDGAGLLGTFGGLGYRVCPKCHEYGTIYSVSVAEFEAQRAIIAAQFPGMRIEGWKPPQAGAEWV